MVGFEEKIMSLVVNMWRLRQVPLGSIKQAVGIRYIICKQGQDQSVGFGVYSMEGQLPPQNGCDCSGRVLRMKTKLFLRSTRTQIEEEDPEKDDNRIRNAWDPQNKGGKH